MKTSGTSVKPASAPDDGQSLSRLLQAAGPSLKPKLRQAAAYLLHHPQDTVLLSLRELADRALVSPATFVRLATALGFDSFEGLRRISLDALQERSPGFESKARSLRGDASLRGADGTNGLSNASNANVEAERLLDRSAAQLVEGLARTRSRNSATAIGDFARHCMAARRLYVLGQRSCYSLAYAFAYIERFVRGDVELVSDDGGTAIDKLYGAQAQDAVVVISQSPYGRVAVELARFAHDRGVPLLVITDEATAPYGAWASQVLYADIQSASFFPTHLGATMLLELVVMMQVAVADPATLTHIADREAVLRASRAYWPVAVAADDSAAESAAKPR